MLLHHLRDDDRQWPIRVLRLELGDVLQQAADKAPVRRG
jgi:hypothetical protein